MHEKLKQKISGIDSQDSDASDDQDHDYVSRAMTDIKNAEDEIDLLNVPQKGVMGMKFMRKHLDAQRDASRNGQSDFQRELDGDYVSSEEEDVPVVRAGRKVYQQVIFYF